MKRFTPLFSEKYNPLTVPNHTEFDIDKALCDLNTYLENSVKAVIPSHKASETISYSPGLEGHEYDEIVYSV